MANTKTATQAQAKNVNAQAPANAGPSKEAIAKGLEGLKKHFAEAKIARQYIQDFLNGSKADEGTKLSEEFRKHLLVLVPMKKSKGEAVRATPRKDAIEKLRALFKANGNKLTLMQIFKEMRWGEHEMQVRCKEAIQKMEASKRMWISYDKASDTYTMEAEGAEAPKGWKGVLPKTAEKPAK